MSEQNIDSKGKGKKKKSKSKRSASSPLDDNGGTGNLNGGIITTQQRKRRQGQKTDEQTVCTSFSDSVCLNGSYTCGYLDKSVVSDNLLSTPAPHTLYRQDFINMAYSQPQYSGYSQQQFVHSSPLGPNVAQPPMAPQQMAPSWATEILEEIKHIKQRMLTVDNIDKTVNLINVKVTDLENNFKSLEKRVSETESTCKFIAESHDSTQEDLTLAKSDIKTLKKMCQTLDEKSKNLESEKTEMMDKITKLELRSMGDNLMFYGIEENDNEDCKQLIRNMWTEHLDMTKEEADAVKVVRAHRVGGKRRGATKPRQIVAKFFDPEQRETIRTLSFEHADALKDSKQGIGVQWPKPIRDKRRELIPTMTSLRKNPRFKDKDVRLVVDKLMVDGKEYTGPRVPTTDDTMP